MPLNSALQGLGDGEKTVAVARHAYATVFFCFALCDCWFNVPYILLFTTCHGTKGRGESESLKLIVSFAP